MNNSVWKHMSCLDMQVMIIKIQYQNTEYFKAKVRYFNQKGDLLHPSVDVIKIYKKDWRKWKPVL